MTWNEWTQIVAKLNASYPDQPINPATAHEWFEELRTYNAGEVWLAIRLLRKEEKFRPGLAELLAGIKLCRRDMREARDRQRSELERLAPSRGVPMPPETKEALRILAESSKPENGIDPAQARAMIESLAQQLIDRCPPDQDEDQAGAA